MSGAGLPQPPAHARAADASARPRPATGYRGAWRSLRLPGLIALGSTIGLVSALVADGPWDALSWLLLGGAAAIGGVLSLRRRAPLPPAGPLRPPRKH